MAITNVKIKSLDAKSLLTNPNIVVLDTKDKLIVNNINVILTSNYINELQSKLCSSATILGVSGLSE